MSIVKRILSILICIICLISMISGCGSGKGKFKVEYDELMEEFNVLELPCTVKLDGKYGYLGEDHTRKSITIEKAVFYQKNTGRNYSTYQAELIVDFSDFSYTEIEDFEDDIWSSGNTCLTNDMHISIGAQARTKNDFMLGLSATDCFHFREMKRVNIDEKKYAFTFSCDSGLLDMFEEDPFDSIHLSFFFGIGEFGYNVTEDLTVGSSGKMESGELITVITND